MCHLNKQKHLDPVSYTGIVIVYIPAKGVLTEH